MVEAKQESPKNVPADMDEQLCEQLRKVILALLPATAECLFIGVAGSRAKNMSSPGSDFDCKVVVKYTQAEYMLQNIKSVRTFKTDMDGVEVEGVIMDILTAVKYAVETNAGAYDTWHSVPILETQASKEIRELYLEAYQPRSVRDHIFGMLNKQTSLLQDQSKKPVEEKNKKTKEARPPLEPGYETNLKIAGEAVYLGLKTVFITNNKSTPPSFKIDELLGATEGMVSKEDKAWIDKLIEDRMTDKTAKYTTTPEFCAFIDKCFEAPKIEKVENATREPFKKKGEAIFFGQFGMTQ